MIRYPVNFVKVGQIWINSVGYKVKVLDYGNREVWLFYEENQNKTAWDLDKFLSEYKPMTTHTESQEK